MAQDTTPTAEEFLDELNYTLTNNAKQAQEYARDMSEKLAKFAASGNLDEAPMRSDLEMYLNKLQSAKVIANIKRKLRVK